MNREARSIHNMNYTTEGISPAFSRHGKQVMSEFLSQLKNLVTEASYHIL